MEVPTNNVLPMTAPGRNPDAPDPKYLMMAAAQMHSEGRLFEPDPHYGYKVNGKEGQEFDDRVTQAYEASKRHKIAPYTQQYDDITKSIGPLNITPIDKPMTRLR